MKADNREEVKRLRGDGLSVKMDSNHKILEIMGDACRISLSKNCGRLLVVGDACRLKVLCNSGEIICRGDGGRILLGPESSKDGVKYEGDGGKIIFDLALRKQFDHVEQQTKQKKNDLHSSKKRCDVSSLRSSELFGERRKQQNSGVKIENLGEATIFFTRTIIKKSVESEAKVVVDPR